MWSTRVCQQFEQLVRYLHRVLGGCVDPRKVDSKLQYFLLGLIAVLFGSWFSCKFKFVLAASVRLTCRICTSHSRVVLPAQGGLVQEHATGYVVSHERFPLLHWCCSRKYYGFVLATFANRPPVRSRYVCFRFRAAQRLWREGLPLC